MPCAGNVPVIVASGSIQWMGTSLAATTIYTPATAGTYRVSLSLSPEANGSYPAGSPATNLKFIWTDSNSVNHSIIFLAGYLDSGAGGSKTADPPFTAGDIAVPSGVSDIQVSADSGAGTVTYDLFYVVEQLA